MAATSLPLRRTSSLDTTILRSLQIDDVDSSDESEVDEHTAPHRSQHGMLMTRWNSLFHKKEDGIDLTRISQPMPELTTALKRSPTLPAYAKAKDLNREPEPRQVATDYALEDRLASRFDWSPPTSPEPASSKRRLPALKTSSARASSDYTPSPRQFSRVSRDAASSSNSSRPSSSSKSMDFGSRVSVPPTPALALPASPRRPTQAPPISQSSKARTRRSIISAPQTYLEELPDFAPPRRAPVPPVQTSGPSMPRSKSHDGARIVYPQPRRAPTALRPPSETLSLSNFDFELPSLMATDDDRLLAMGSRDSSSKPASPRRAHAGHSRTASTVSSGSASSPRRARGSKPSSPKRQSRSRALPTPPPIGARISSRPQHRRTASATSTASATQVEEHVATTPPLVWASVKSPALNASPALPTRSPLRERRKLGLGADGQPLVLTALPKSARPRSAGASSVATPPPMPPPTGPLPEVPSYFDMADQYLSGNDNLMRQSVIPPSTSTAPDLDSLLRPSNRLRSDSASVYSLPSPAAANFPLPPAGLPTRASVLSPVQEQTAPVVVAGSMRAARRPSTADAALPGMEILTVATSPRRKPQGPRPDSTSSFSSTSPSSYTSTYSTMGRYGTSAGRNRASILSNGSGSSGSGSAQSRMSITSPFSGGSSTSGTLGPATPPSQSAAVGAGASFSGSPPTASSSSPRGLGLSLGTSSQQHQSDPWPRVSSPAMSTFTTGSGGSGGGYVSARSSTSTMLLFEALRLDIGEAEQKKGTTTAMGRSRSALATGTVYGQGDEDGDEQTVWPASAGARYGFAM